MIRSTVNLYAAPIGLNPANVLTAQINLPEAKYPRPEDEINFHRMLKRRLDSLPGVEATSLVSNLPFGRWIGFSYELEGTPEEAGSWPQTGAIIATSDYFRAMQIRIRRGRAFTDSDGLTGPPVVMVNESFAREYWPSEDVIGKRMRLIKN